MKRRTKHVLFALLLWSIANSFALGQLPYEIKRAYFSSDQYKDFNPIIVQDMLLFSSNRGDESLLRYEASGQFPLYNLFSVALDGEGKMPEPVIFSLEFATTTQNTPLTMSPDGKTILFCKVLESASVYDHSAQEEPCTGLFFATLNNGKWTQQEAFPFNSIDYSITSPCFGADGNSIFFVSDMPGGFGGMDIYRSGRTNSGWTVPENLGEQINSPYNEDYPFLTSGGMIFFTSNNPDGLGKMDIYFSKTKDGTWMSPVHLPAPLNSVEDDLGIVTDDAFQEGYFFSSREGIENIYSFKTLIPLLVDCDTMIENNYCFEFFDEMVQGIDTLPVTYEWVFSDGYREKGLVIEHCLPGPGNYWANLNIIDNRTSNTFFTQSILEFSITDFEQAYINSYDAGIVKDSMLFDALKSNLPENKITEYYWDFGDRSFGTGPQTGHVYEKTGIYEVKLGLQLVSPVSEKRELRCVLKSVQVVADNQQLAMLSAGKKAKPLEPGKAGGEGKDVVQEFSVFDVNPDEEVFRVEVLESEEKILIEDSIFDPLRYDYEIREFFLPDDSIYSYTVGEFDNLLSTYEIYNDVVEKGFNTATVQTYVLAELPTAIIEKINREFAEFADANFEFDKAEVSEVSYPVLDKVVEIMIKYPDLVMEIAAHTDNIGSFEYNMLLSQRRAESIINYMVSKGIERIRLVAKGYGESMPVESNATEEGRKINRRVEFIILNE